MFFFSVINFLWSGFLKESAMHNDIWNVFANSNLDIEIGIYNGCIAGKWNNIAYENF